MNKILIALLLFTLTGCATLTTIASNPIVQTGVKYGIIKLLAEKPEKQSEMLKIVNELQRYSDQQVRVTIYELEDYALEIIPWDSMDRADQALALDMLTYAASELRRLVGDGELQGDAKVKIENYLNWIEQAVRFAG